MLLHSRVCLWTTAKGANHWKQTDKRDLRRGANDTATRWFRSNNKSRERLLFTLKSESLSCIHSEWFASHPNHIHRFTPITICGFHSWVWMLGGEFLRVNYWEGSLLQKKGPLLQDKKRSKNIPGFDPKFGFPKCKILQKFCSFLEEHIY